MPQQLTIVKSEPLTIVKSEPAVAPQPEYPSTMGMVKNFFTGGAEQLGGILKLAGNAAAYYADPVKGAIRLSPTTTQIATHPGETVQGIGTALKNRYGGVDQLLGTAYHDPFGSAMDVAGALSAGGALAKATGLPRFAATLARGSEVMNPVSTMGRVAEGVLDPAARKLMTSAYKVTGRDAIKTAPEIVDTALSRGLNPTRGGYNKAENLIGASEDAMQPAVTAAAARGAAVNPVDAADVSRATEMFQGVAPQRDMAAINRVRSNFIANNSTERPMAPDEILRSMQTDSRIPSGGMVQEPQPIPVDKALNMARTEGRLLRKKFGELKTSEIEARKDIRHGIRESVGRQVPEVDAQLAEQRRLLQAQGAMERRIPVSDRRNIGGIAPIAPTSLRTLLMLADSSPAIKGWLARILYRGGQAGGATAGIADPLARAMLLQHMAPAKPDGQP